MKQAYLVSHYCYHTHGGAIELVDNEPTGCRFICTLPMEEVDIHE